MFFYVKVYPKFKFIFLKLLKIISKLFLPLIASAGLVNSAEAFGSFTMKPMQIFRFKTPEMVLYVNSTVSLLNSEENPNKRHLKNLLKCQKLFSSGKKSVRGMEINTLKACKAYMNMGLYQTSSIRNLEIELETLKQLIKSNNENQNSNKSINEIKKDNLDYQEERLLKLKVMFDKGLISEKEYKKLRQKTLGF